MKDTTYADLQTLYVQRAKLINAICQGIDTEANREKLDALREQIETLEQALLNRGSP